jgi:hypothetical protein
MGNIIKICLGLQTLVSIWGCTPAYIGYIVKERAQGNKKPKFVRIFILLMCIMIALLAIINGSIA